MKVFLDTGFFLAFFVASEKHHSAIVRKYKQYRKGRALFFTSTYILDELFTRLVYDFGNNETLKIVRRLDASLAKGEIALLEIDGTVFKKATEVLLKFSEHRISFTDATTYVLYKELKLDEVFTLDSDFQKIGAKTSL